MPCLFYFLLRYQSHAAVDSLTSSGAPFQIHHHFHQCLAIQCKNVLILSQHWKLQIAHLALQVAVTINICSLFATQLKKSCRKKKKNCPLFPVSFTISFPGHFSQPEVPEQTYCKHRTPDSSTILVVTGEKYIQLPQEDKTKNIPEKDPCNVHHSLIQQAPHYHSTMTEAAMVS